jgi:hypothetical protein
MIIRIYIHFVRPDQEVSFTCTWVKSICYSITVEKCMSSQVVTNIVEDMVKKVKKKTRVIYGMYKGRFDFLTRVSDF